MNEIKPQTAEKDEDSAKLEYDALAEESYKLATMVARKRADIALKRAEAATFAVSLESAKEQLDNALRDESLLHAQGSSSPQSNTSSPTFADRSLILALEGQIDVTKASIEEAQEKKYNLEKEILETVNSRQNIQRAPSFSNKFSTSPVQKAITGLSLDENNQGNTSTKYKNLVDEMELKLPPPAQTDNSEFLQNEDLFKTLEDGTKCDSTFRSDHGRIWRDATMPNLILIPKDTTGKPTGSTSLGVVVERVFEGINCFIKNKTDTSETSSTDTENASGTLTSKMSTGAEEKLDRIGEAYKTSQSVADLVIKQFGALTARIGVDGFQTKIIAPKVALDRFLQLSRGTDMSPTITPKHEPKAQETELSTMQSLNLNNDKETQKLSKSTPSPVRVKNPMAEQMAERILQPSAILKPEHFADIVQEGVPIRFHQSALNLIYSTNHHGMSLHTLYHKTKKTSPTIIAIKDTRGRIFGCYGAQIWKSSAVRYYGSGECFVFGVDGASDCAKVFKWSRENSLFQFTSGTFLAVGGGAGSHFALWIDEDLLMGTTSQCATFSNPPLTDVNQKERIESTEFKILSLEVWGFTPHRNR